MTSREPRRQESNSPRLIASKSSFLLLFNQQRNNTHVESYEEKIDHLREESMSGDVARIEKALETAIELLEEINDERQSVWQMLDDIKASDVKNHKSAQYDSIEKSLARVRTLMMTKVGEA